MNVRLPGGVSVQFDNNGMETYGTVTATITAASNTLLGPFTWAARPVRSTSPQRGSPAGLHPSYPRLRSLWTSPGVYQIAFSLDGGSTNYTTFVSVIPATSPDFAVNPAAPASIKAGKSVSFTTQLAPVNGFSRPVTLSSPGLAGVTLAFAPGTIPLSGGAQTETVTVTAANAATQTSLVLIVASGNGILHITYVPARFSDSKGATTRRGISGVV